MDASIAKAFTPFLFVMICLILGLIKRAFSHNEDSESENESGGFLTILLEGFMVLMCLIPIIGLLLLIFG